ncbi:MAG: hypothetical protein SGJ07_15165 [Rhodospirillaceae bacterium]|nr:hypothetical protein [Rhodospirillaceae bacterium]
MLTKLDKAYVAGLVSFLCMQLQHWAGFTVDPTIQAAAVGVILFIVTYVTPNKTPA